MTTIDTSALSAQAVWTRFIDRADVNGDGNLDREEMEAIDPKADFDKIIAEHDANGDGVLNSDELPKGAFSPMLFEQLLNAQEYRDATPDTRATDDAKAVAQLFERADLDGDGVLSQEEWDAERALGMSRFADGGEPADVSFLVRRDVWNKVTGEGADGEKPAGLRPEDILVGRRMALTPMSADELPDDWDAQIARLAAASENLPADQRPQLEQIDPAVARAEMKAKVDQMPMSAAFMTRLIMSLSESALAEA